VPIEVSPPKYVLIVNAVQERIESGAYPAGAMIPSETELMREFGASRPIVVRALDLLRQDGWIESHQGKGRFALGPPTRGTRRGRDRTYTLLDGAETAHTTLLSAGQVPAPPRAATALGIEPGTPLVARRRLVVVPDVGPVELGTTYIPLDLAAGTAVGSPEPLPEGLLSHLTKHGGVVFDHAVERVSAKLPTAEEARLLEVGRRDPLLSVLLAVCDRTGRPLLAVDVVMPASRHGLEDVFPVG
jgi:DNA-binding GntR family transcriptional regulator